MAGRSSEGTPASCDLKACSNRPIILPAFPAYPPGFAPIGFLGFLGVLNEWTVSVSFIPRIFAKCFVKPLGCAGFCFVFTRTVINFYIRSVIVTMYFYHFIPSWFSGLRYGVDPSCNIKPIHSMYVFAAQLGIKRFSIKILFSYKEV